MRWNKFGYNTTTMATSYQFPALIEIIYRVSDSADIEMIARRMSHPYHRAMRDSSLHLHMGHNYRMYQYRMCSGIALINS